MKEKQFETKQSRTFENKKNYKFERVENFKYLRDILNKHNSYQTDLQERIKEG